MIFLRKRCIKIRYIDLANKSRDAFLHGIDILIDNTLPSVWDDNATGWHERWQSGAKSTGIYASCEGTILLTQIKDRHRSIEVNEMIKRVYTKHLCKVFDNEYVIESGEWEQTRINQREQSINVSFKMAKFLLASGYIDDSLKDEHVVNNIVEKLLSLYDAGKKQFRNVTYEDLTSLASTVFAFIALKRHLDKNHHILLQVKEQLMEILTSPIYDDNYICIILSAWAVSESLEMFDNKQICQATNALKRAMKCENKGDTIAFEEYIVKDKDLDTFRYNKNIIYLHTIINFINSGFLKFENYISIIEDIVKIVETTQAEGMYIREDKKMFWENYQALLLINDLYKLIMNNVKDEESFMIINPKFFIKHEFSINEKLAAILMPFGEDMPKSVLGAFERAVRGYGYEPWRSDKKHSQSFIMQDIWENINQAKFVIADCTGRNPNVFYELGIAHTIGKPVFMCAQRPEDFPFDISHIRHFVYNSNDILPLIEEIEKFMQEL